MKVITCPHCGKLVATPSLGRPATKITVIEVCDALRLLHDIPAAAQKLGCSRALIYKILKQYDLTPIDFSNGRIKK
jgi:hypothetical protein